MVVTPVKTLCFGKLCLFWLLLGMLNSPFSCFGDAGFSHANIITTFSASPGGSPYIERGRGSMQRVCKLCDCTRLLVQNDSDLLTYV